MIAANAVNVEIASVLYTTHPPAYFPSHVIIGTLEKSCAGKAGKTSKSQI